VIWLYIGISIFFGVCAFAVERFLSSEGVPFLERADGRRWFKSPMLSGITLGLIVAVIWPLAVIGAIL
jgi:hypothetical protein